MDLKYLTLGGAVGLLAVTALHAEWTRVVDFESYELTTDESQIAEQGWLFQDYDFAGYVECTDGSRDCSGLRAIVEAPYEGGNGKAILVRAGDPDVVDPSNTRSVTAFDLPEPIPFGEVGTFYMRFAVDSREISAHWGLTTYTEPGSDNGVFHSYGDLATASQVAFDVRETLGLYNGGWVDATTNPDQVLATETWYEMWYQIHNVTDGYADVFIRGGVFGELTHLKNPYLDGFTDWAFRDKREGPLARFLCIMVLGIPHQNPVRFGGIFFDDMWINVGELTTEQPDLRAGGGDDNPPPAPTSLWENVEPEPDSDWKWTGIGWVFDVAYPWIYHDSAQSWMYVAHEFSTLEGILLYEDASQGWLWTSNAYGGWYYSYAGEGTWSDWTP